METKEKKTFGEVLRTEPLVLVDFTAVWCGPCKMMKPILEELKSSMGDKVRIIQVDVDKNQKLAAMFQVRGVPTFAIFKNGELKWMQAGMQMLQQLKDKVEQFSDETVDH